MIGQTRAGIALPWAYLRQGGDYSQSRQLQLIRAGGERFYSYSSVPFLVLREMDVAKSLGHSRWLGMDAGCWSEGTDYYRVEILVN